MKTIILFIPVIFLSFVCKAQSDEQISTEINWLTIEEAVKLQEESPRTILIDMYTDWCGWCKKLDTETFSNPAIAAYINANFYPVKFNAERTDTVVYRGNTYVNANTGRRSSHQLAQQLMGGRMSYPTIVYIDPDFKANPVPGYVDVKAIEPILVYFAEKVYKSSDFSQFSQDFKNTFSPDSTSKIKGNINWLEFNETLKLTEEKPKKVLIYVNSDYNNSSKIMLGSTYKHPVIADNINEDFYPVKFNFDSQDTIYLQGNPFINEQKTPGYPHQFAIAVLQPEITLPSTIFMDEELKVIFVLRGYYSPQTLERFIEFIGDDMYKNGTDWQEYNKNFKSKLE